MGSRSPARSDKLHPYNVYYSRSHLDKQTLKNRLVKQYHEQHLEQAATMSSSVSTRCRPHKPQNTDRHRIRQLNLAKIDGLYGSHP